MPKYRQLHTKIIDSFDFNEMPSDFHRVTWMLLPLIVDSAGRGIYNAAWLRSKLYPLRDDATTAQIMDVFVWFVERKMIETYLVKGKEYFWIPSFAKHQYHLERETPSILPEPPQLRSNAGVMPEEVRSYAGAYESASASDYESESAYESKPELVQKTIPQIVSEASGLSSIPPKEKERTEQIHSLVDKYGAQKVTETLKASCDKWVATRGKSGRFYTKTNMGWVDWAQEMLDGNTSGPLRAEDMLVPGENGRVNI